jgi:hypothetical protein
MQCACVVAVLTQHGRDVPLLEPRPPRLVSAITRVSALAPFSSPYRIVCCAGGGLGSSVVRAARLYGGNMAQASSRCAALTAARHGMARWRGFGWGWQARHETEDLKWLAPKSISCCAALHFLIFPRCEPGSSLIHPVPLMALPHGLILGPPGSPVSASRSFGPLLRCCPALLTTRDALGGSSTAL